MARGKTPKKMRLELRREQVSRMYLMGRTEREIGEALGVSQATVSRDLEYLRERWRAESMRNTQEIVAIELKKLEQVEREAWDAWSRSMAPRVFKSGASTEIKGGSAKASRGKAGEGKVVKAMEETTSDGDNAFLRTILECSDRRRKIKGIDAPTKHEVNDVSNRPLDQLASRFLSICETHSFSPDGWAWSAGDVPALPAGAGIQGGSEDPGRDRMAEATGAAEEEQIRNPDPIAP